MENQNKASKALKFAFVSVVVVLGFLVILFGLLFKSELDKASDLSHQLYMAEEAIEQQKEKIDEQSNQISALEVQLAAASKPASSSNSSSSSSSSASASSSGSTSSTSSTSDTQSVTVYVTRTGEKYHRSGCQYLRESKIPIELGTAKARGYTACSVCF